MLALVIKLYVELKWANAERLRLEAELKKHEDRLKSAPG